MTRAVAEKGVKLVEGTHQSQYVKGPVITIKQANGLLREVPFDEDDGTTPVLIEAMILELDIEDVNLREAVRKDCLDFLEGWKEAVGDEEAYETLPLNEFYSRAEAFIAGYKFARRA